MSRAKSALVLARRVAEDKRRLEFARTHAKDSVGRLERDMQESTAQFNAIRAELTAEEAAEFEAGYGSVMVMVGM